MWSAGKYGSLFVLIAGLACVASPGCGQAPGVVPGVGGSTGTDSGSTNGSGTPSFTIPSGLTPSYNFDFEMKGQAQGLQSNGSSLQVSAGTQLYVQIRAGQGQALGGFTVGYNCEWFRVTVGNVSKWAYVKKEYYNDVPLLNHWTNFDPCSAAGTTWAGDYSAALSAGHGPLTIQIDRAQYDNCYGYDNPPASFVGVDNGGCAPRAVLSTHGVTGTASVYTN